jgi:hypothetical protein
MCLVVACMYLCMPTLIPDTSQNMGCSFRIRAFVIPIAVAADVGYLHESQSSDLCLLSIILTSLQTSTEASCCFYHGRCACALIQFPSFVKLIQIHGMMPMVPDGWIKHDMPAYAPSNIFIANL